MSTREKAWRAWSLPANPRWHPRPSFCIVLGVARARDHAYSNGANGSHGYSSFADECFAGGEGEGVRVLASGGVG